MIIRIDGIPFKTIEQRIEEERRDSIPALASTQEYSTQEIVQESDTKGAIKELNNDDVDVTTRMSGIDMRSILHPFDIGPLARTDTLVAMKFLPVTCLHLTRQKKRLSVSIRGIGRQQVVDLAAGKREQELKAANSGLMDRVKGFIGGNK